MSKADNKQLKTIVEKVNSCISDAKDLYECTYGVTTYDDITNALADKKLLVCRYNGDLYSYSSLSSKKGYIFNTASETNSHSLYVSTANAWSMCDFIGAAVVINADYSSNNDTLDVAAGDISAAFRQSSLTLVVNYDDENQLRLQNYSYIADNDNLIYTITFRHPEPKGIHCFNLIITQNEEEPSYSSTSTWETYGKAGDGIVIATDGTISAKPKYKHYFTLYCYNEEYRMYALSVVLTTASSNTIVGYSGLLDAISQADAATTGNVPFIANTIYFYRGQEWDGETELKKCSIDGVDTDSPHFGFIYCTKINKADFLRITGYNIEGDFCIGSELLYDSQYTTSTDVVEKIN